MKHSSHLLAILIIITVVLMSSFVGVRYYFSSSASKQELQVLSDNIGARIASAVQPTIWNIYNKSTERKYSEEITSALLDSEFLDPHVIGISVYGNFGHVFMARYKTAEGEIVEHSQGLHDHAVNIASNRSLTSVKQGAMTIGNVLVLLGDAPNKALMRKILLLELGQVLVVSSFFVVFLFYAIRKSLVIPARELEEANVELEEFSYRVSHDLKSPIISSLTLLRMMETGSDKAKNATSDMKTKMSMVIKSLEQLERLLDDIHSILVIRSKEEEDKNIDLEDVIETSLSILSHLDGALDVDVITDYCEDNTVYTKPTRLIMIVENLISNAIKYQDKSKSEKYIKFTTKREGQQFVLDIEDNGLGIPKDMHSDIFEMFKRFHPRASFGSGLGLYLVRKSADKINADIEFIHLDHGSKFRLTLPINQKDARA